MLQTLSAARNTGAFAKIGDREVDDIGNVGPVTYDNRSCTQDIVQMSFER